jgi:hypothetical protein
MITSTIPMSNAKAERELGWQSTAATVHDGLAAEVALDRAGELFGSAVSPKRAM